MLKIYNSMTRKKEIFTPLQPGKVKMYICGPTVYDYCHLGNARTYAAFDVVIRCLRWMGYDVEYVRNITDVDDKIINRARENNVTFKEVVEQFTQAMQEDFAALGLLQPTVEPRATEFIPPIIALIEKLIANDHAYVARNGDVYYDVRHFKTYGCLSHRNIEHLKSGARVEINDVKRDPLDFVLWKLAKPGEPHWPSPWGEGRPGWHIECSAMATRTLGDTFDIHGGGKDLIFPHHENEIAQSEGATEKKFVRVWMHAGYLQMEKEKMSKSLGNFLTVRALLLDHPPEVLRFFLMTSHYRSPLQYSSDALIQARHALERFYTALRDLPIVDKNVCSAENDFSQRFQSAMEDDFNTPVGLSILFELAHDIQRLRENDLTLAAEQGALLRQLGGVLGILQDDPETFLRTRKEALAIDAEKIDALIVLRNEARAQKNWAEADRVRAELAALSIILEDNAAGTTWRVGEP